MATYNEMFSQMESSCKTLRQVLSNQPRTLSKSDPGSNGVECLKCSTEYGDYYNWSLDTLLDDMDKQIERFRKYKLDLDAIQSDATDAIIIEGSHVVDQSFVDIKNEIDNWISKFESFKSDILSNTQNQAYKELNVLYDAVNSAYMRASSYATSMSHAYDEISKLDYDIIDSETRSAYYIALHGAYSGLVSSRSDYRGALERRDELAAYRSKVSEAMSYTGR